ncbi:MAG: M24 family metallopeptidase [Limnohabitans sp.]|nr:M24 family metallopeptidase [Limnohabitans sp.]
MTIQDLAIYSGRRQRLCQQLGEHSVAIIPTAPEQTRNRDSHFLYRHDSYFYYLTGFTEPNACLILFSNGKSVLFCQPKDMEREIWDGFRIGPSAAVDALGVDEAFSNNDLQTQLSQLLENQHCVWYPFATHAGLNVQIEQALEKVRSRVRMGVICPSIQKDLCILLDEMRIIKDAHEINIMRRACHISAQAHIRAMQLSAKMLRADQPVYEYHLDAELLHAFRQEGSQDTAYGSIVAAGANACVLHYRADAAPIRNGDLVLVDAGCELDSYASDITRTFPANGKFSSPQRAIYDLVLASQVAAVEATQAGARFTALHEAAVQVLSQGLLDLGILSKDKHGTCQDVIDKRAYFQFYMHRTSHWLGMDVHDCGSYIEASEIDNTITKQDPVTGQTIRQQPSRILREGMVLTIEPGLYIRPTPGLDEKYWNIGIRIEDDAVVTAKGCDLISRGVPVDPDEIEALMSN